METNKYKLLLEEEKKRLLDELATVARKNPNQPGDWEAVETDLGADSADENEVADEVEDFGENQAILAKLEPQLAQVDLALKKIADGTYGKCDVCGEEISEDRLNANPSATTCVEHAK